MVYVTFYISGLNVTHPDMQVQREALNPKGAKPERRFRFILAEKKALGDAGEYKTTITERKSLGRKEQQQNKPTFIEIQKN